MKQNCNCSKPCGCGDNVMDQNVPCQSGYPDCPFPEKCSETISSDCVIYTGDNIVNLDIQKGMRMSDIVHKLVNVIVNPGCSYPNSPCISVIGLQSLKITSTMIYLGWGAITGNPDYRVEYRLANASVWTTNPVITTNTDVIGNLIPNTTYHIRVATICSESNICYSLTLEITTKS